MTELGDALRSIGPAPPDAFVRVDDAAGALAPDLVERSIAFDARGLRPWRATYYFDTDIEPRGARAGACVAELAEALGVVAPAPLLEPLERASVLQHVIGVDASAPLRLKRYLIFREPDRAFVESLLERVERPSEHVARGRVYILGFDIGADGLCDVKLYFDLELDKVRPFLRGRPELLPVLAGSRQVVLGQRESGRQTMYFHASGPGVLRAELDRRAAIDPRAGEVRERLRALSARHAMDAWIAGIPRSEGRLEESALTLYLHPRADTTR